MAVIVFRADGSKDIGGGHIYRCLTLAEALREQGCYIHFICRKAPGDMVELILHQGFGVSIIPGHQAFCQQDDAIASRAVLEALYPDLIVVDHYQLDAKWHKQMAPLCQHLMVIDDLANRPYHCDLLFDQSLARNQAHYQPWLDDRCQQLIVGAKYALLRQQFIEQRQQALAKREQTKEVKHILVSLGATDPDNLTEQVLAQLDTKRFQVTVVLSAQAKHLDRIREYVAKRSGISLKVNVENMAEVITQADMAIAAAGTSMLERCCLGLPNILICAADNQAHIVQAAADSGAAIGTMTAAQVDTHLLPMLTAFVDAKEPLQSLSKQAAKVCDGSGISELTQRLQQLRNASRYHLERVDWPDMMVLYQWQQAPETRRFARDPKPPKLSDHQRWFGKVMQSPEIDFYLLVKDKQPLGFVRLNPTTNGHEVSIAIAPQGLGQGLGPLALKLLAELHQEKTLLAYIDAHNSASIKAFAKAGFTPIGDNWYQRGSKQHES